MHGRMHGRLARWWLAVEQMDEMDEMDETAAAASTGRLVGRWTMDDVV